MVAPLLRGGPTSALTLPHRTKQWAPVAILTRDWKGPHPRDSGRRRSRSEYSTSSSSSRHRPVR